MREGRAGDALRACRWLGVVMLAVAAMIGGSVTSQVAPGTGMNVLFITLDSWRPHNLAAYGYGRTTMPAFESWAQSAVLFPPVQATSAWTFPGLASLFTGLYPARHGVDARGRELRDVVTLQSVLVEAGYRVPTLSHFPGTPGMRGFAIEERWHNPVTAAPGTVLEWLASAAAHERPFLAWDHWRGSHLPYAPAAEYASEFGAGGNSPAADLVRSFVVIPADIQAFAPEDREAIVAEYDATLRSVDEQLATLFAALDTGGLADNTIVVITADHGEELLEHGLVGHASTSMYAQMFEEVLQTPFVIRIPGARLTSPDCGVSQVDILPTLLTLLGLPVPADLDGRDLGPAMMGGGCVAVPRFAESIQGGFQSRGLSAETFLWAVRDGADKLIVTRSPDEERRQLYDLAADPAEQHDRARDNPATVTRLRALLDDFMAARGGPEYWRGREDNARLPRRVATEVMAAPRILDPPVGTALEFVATSGTIRGTWTGSPAATYVIEYDVGEGANRTQGTFEVIGTRYEFGPVPVEVWNNLSQFNPWRLRLWPAADTTKKSPWARFTVVRHAVEE